jgi:hypothetical protein
VKTLEIAPEKVCADLSELLGISESESRNLVSVVFEVMERGRKPFAAYTSADLISGMNHSLGRRQILEQYAIGVLKLLHSYVAQLENAEERLESGRSDREKSKVRSARRTAENRFKRTGKKPFWSDDNF